MKKLINLLVILFALTLSAQKKVSLAIYQDVKLATIGDIERGYDAFTPNFIIRAKMQGHQQKHGYMIVYPEFEYAQIKGDYYRYSLNVGYTFNELILDRLEASIQGGWGFIDRYDKNLFSGSVSGELAYKINDRLKVALLAQFTERKDLAYFWNDKTIRFSGFIGIEYNIF